MAKLTQKDRLLAARPKVEPARPCTSCARPSFSRPRLDGTVLCRSCKTKASKAETRAEILKEIERWHRERLEVPALRDLPIFRKARWAFGSWASAVTAAGLTPVAQGANKLPARVPTRDRIPITSRGKVAAWALVDPEDYDLLADRHWNFGSDGYARGRCREYGAKSVGMHRLILGLKAGDGLDVDHINGDRLDNRRSNLRVATRGENLQNRTVPSTGITGFRGVTPHGDAFVAQASQNNGRVYIGRFTTALEAAIAAQEWRDENMPFAQPDPALVEALGAWPQPVQALAA